MKNILSDNPELMDELEGKIKEALGTTNVLTSVEQD